jgi:putative sterol carrier protein
MVPPCAFPAQGETMTADIFTLERITERLRREAVRAEGFGKSVKFDFGEGGILSVDATQSPPQVSNEDIDADTTLGVSLADFTKLARGELDPMRAIFTRRLKVSGDIGAAMKLATLFRDRG